MTKVLIAIPFIRPFEWSFVEGLIALEKPEGTLVRAIGGRPVDEARNRLCLEALEARASHILFIDNDMRPAKGALSRLLSRDTGIVSGLAFGRAYPHWPISIESALVDSTGYKTYRVDIEGTEKFLLKYRRWWPTMVFRGGLLPMEDPEGYIERRVVGMAFTLIATEILSKMTPDWKEQKDKGEIPGWFELRDRVSGEDAYFCEVARALSYPIMLDRTVVVGHGYGDQNISPMDFIGYRAFLRTLPMDEFEEFSKLGME